MHDPRLVFHDGLWYGVCSCGWQSGGYQSEDGAVGACITHNEAQLN